MSNKEILEKVMDKIGMDKSIYDWERMMDNHGYFDIIFSHDFVKAFFGEHYIYALMENDNLISEKDYRDLCDIGQNMDCYKQPAWMYHIQQLVLEEEPIKYLEKYV